MTQTARIALSSKGLQMADRISRKDFRFVSGSDAIVCDQFQAAFISPRVANLLLSDPSIDEFVLRDTDSGSLNILRDMISGVSVIVSERNVGHFFELIENLENAELSE
jgi:hypothetical protein